MRRSNILSRRWYSLPVRSSVNHDARWKSVWSSNSARSCSCTASQASQATPTAVHQNNTPQQPSPASAADHRVIGTAQDLFVASPYSPGSPLFLPNGTHVLNKLISFLRAQYAQYGFQEVLTPNIYKKSLWEISGHWQNYKDDMYEVSGRGASGQKTDGEIGEDESYGLKPMNCPGHCLLFKAQSHSYRELPLRYADFSPLHRNEVSGSLSGLTRVRRFHQDDGHVFCRPQQIRSEIESALSFTDTVMKTFGFRQYRLVLSTRPKKDFIGSIELWNSAEQQLREALERSGKEWEINEGDGAFYGPKIDFQLQDSDGKFHQLSTIQLDMNLPQRFGLEYAVAEGEEDYDLSRSGKATPVMIHRAIFGSLERFFALLIEQYNGRWPFWISPRQAIILTVNQDKKILEAADNAAVEMSGYRGVGNGDAETKYLPTAPLSPLHATFRVDVDKSNRSLGKKIREAKKMKYNLIFVLGEKNLADGSVDVDLAGQNLPSTELSRGPFDGVPCWDVVNSQDGSAAKMKMKVEDVYDWFIQMERRFQ